MAVQSMSIVESHAEPKGRCAFTDRDALWVETVQARGTKYSISNPVLLLLLQRKILALGPCDAPLKNAMADQFMRMIADHERVETPIHFYWGMKEGYLGAAYLARGIVGVLEKLRKYQPVPKVHLTCVADTKGAGLFAALAVPYEQRKIMPGVKVNLHALAKPEKSEDDRAFTEHYHFMKTMAGDLAKASKQYTEEKMSEIIDNIYNSYKYLYAIPGEIKTFIELYANRLATTMGISEEEAKKLIDEDRWMSAEEAVERKIFSSLVTDSKEIEADLKPFGL